MGTYHRKFDIILPEICDIVFVKLSLFSEKLSSSVSQEIFKNPHAFNAIFRLLYTFVFDWSLRCDGELFTFLTFFTILHAFRRIFFILAFD